MRSGFDLPELIVQKLGSRGQVESDQLKDEINDRTVFDDVPFAAPSTYI